MIKKTIPPDLKLSPARIILMSLDLRMIYNPKIDRFESNYWFRVIMRHCPWGDNEFGVEYAVEGSQRFQTHLN